MELLSLDIENFGSVGKISVPLNKEGLILVTGINKDAPKADSNGSGKSLLFEAICWCVWGETVRGLSGDEVVNTRVGKDCCVKLSFVEQDTKYSIVRHRLDSRVKKPNDLIVLSNDVPLGMTGKMKSMQDVVNQLVGFDFHTFRAMMPGAGIKVANLTDKAIKELLEALLQTEQLSEAYELAREKSKALESRIASAKAKIVSFQQQLFQLNKHLDDILNTKSTIEAETARRKSELDARIESLRAEAAEVADRLSAEPALQQTHNHLTKDAADFNAKIIAEIVEPQKALLKEEANKVRNLEDSLTRERHSLSLLRVTAEQLDKLGNACDSCKQAITDEHKADVQVAHYQKIQAQLVVIQALEAKLLRASNNKSDMEVQALAMLTEKERELRQKTLQAAEVEKELQQLSNVRKLKARIDADLSREQDALEKLFSNTPNFDDLISEQVKKAVSLASDVSKQLTEIKNCNSELELCSFWVNGFSPSGLRSFMLDYVTPILNDRAKYYSDLLTNKEMEVTFSTKSTLKNGQTKEKFSICCKQAHGSESYAGSSAGERARADLVIAMALGDLAQLRTAKQLPWRFLDEPFESIDQSGIEAIVRLLNDQKSRYKTVFVVTHKTEFKEMFSQHITVVKENGLSSLVFDA